MQTPHSVPARPYRENTSCRMGTWKRRAWTPGGYLEAGAKSGTSTERVKSVLLTYSVYLHRDKRKKEEKQEPTELLREKTLSKTCGSETLMQKLCQQLHNMTTWLENRSPWNKPERCNSHNSSWQEI